MSETKTISPGSDHGSVGQLTLSTGTKTMYVAFLVLGVLTFVVGAAVHNDRASTSYFVSFFFFTSLALGGLFFTALQHMTSAGWSVTIRRVPESFASYLPVAAITALLLF